MKNQFGSLQQAVLMLCCVVLCSCGGEQTHQVARDYKTQVLEQRDIALSQEYSATIRGRQDIDIFAQVGGTITKVCVSEGEVVRRGQSLFVIDQVPYEAALQMADANVEAAEAAVATAQLTADSKQTLYNRGVISEYELSTARNMLATCKAQLAQAKAAQVSANNNYTYTLVKSPADGIVGTIPFREGSLVSPQTPQPLTTVSDNSQMYVYFSMTENALLALLERYGSIDDMIKSMPEVSLVMSNGKEYMHKGRIESVSGVINTSTGTVSVRAVFPNAERMLHSGASGNILVSQTTAGAIYVPKSATFEIQDKIYVYKSVDGVARQTLITVAPIGTTENYVVTAGLSAGDEIVIEGVALLRDGDCVKPSAASAKEEV